MQKVANCVGCPTQSAVERAVTRAKHRRHAGTMQRPAADTTVHTGIIVWPHCTDPLSPGQSPMEGNQRCDIGDLGYSLFMGGNSPLFRRKPNVFRFLNLVSGKDNECKVPVPASSQTKSLEIRLLKIQNIDSWMEPTVFTSPRRFRLRKTPQPSTAQHGASCSRN